MTDKEKLEKALVHLKKFIDGDCVCDSDILADFPELEDSNDEKIRKALVKIVKSIGLKVFEAEGVGKNDVLLYLDRVKEKHPLEDFSRGYNEGYYHGVTDKEKKPVMPKDFGVAKDNCKGAHLVLDEKKPDYSGLNDFERAIHRGFLCAGVENVPVTIIKETAQDCLAHIPAWSEIEDIADHLDNLGNTAMADTLRRFRPQPKQEWSKEDESILEALIYDIERLPMQGVLTHRSCDSYIKFLKALRPGWKPSEDEERLINTSISFLKDFADKGYENAVECIDWLKSKLNGNTCK